MKLDFDKQNKLKIKIQDLIIEQAESGMNVVDCYMAICLIKFGMEKSFIETYGKDKFLELKLLMDKSITILNQQIDSDLNFQKEIQDIKNKNKKVDKDD